MVKWVSAFGLSNNNKWRWWMWMVPATYWRTHSPSQLAWSESWRPPGAQSAFIRWTGWTLALTMVTITHHRHCRWLVELLLLLLLLLFGWELCSWMKQPGFVNWSLTSVEIPCHTYFWHFLNVDIISVVCFDPVNRTLVCHFCLIAWCQS